MWLARKNYDRAISDYDRLLDIDPKSPFALEGRGTAFAGKGDLARAIVDYDRALRIDPGSASVVERRNSALSKLAGAQTGSEAAVPAASPTVSEPESRPRTAGAASPDAAARPIPSVTPPTIGIPAARRLALVIGNGAYANVPTLRNPTADARAIGDKLKTKGFDVTLTLDTGRSKMLETVSAFLRSITKDAEVLVYYAGHGVEFDGANYIVPVDMPAFSADAEELIKDNSINLNSLLVEIGRRKTGAAVVILDACRDNPFRNVQVAGLSRSIAAKDGLAPVAAPRGVFVLYSAGVNQKALDRLSADDPDPNGLFTRKLLPLMDEQGLEIRTMATRLRREVSAAARGVTITDRDGHDQSPSSYDQMDGDFFFTPAR